MFFMCALTIINVLKYIFAPIALDRREYLVIIMDNFC